MSFTNNPLLSNSPNYIRCYYILRPKLLNNSNNTTLGELSGPFSITEINTTYPNFSQQPKTIIRNITGQSKNFIVGIPKYNGNNVSSKKIYSAMSLYDINFLTTIVPYKKLAGNDTTIPENLEDCNTQIFSSNGNVEELNRTEIKGIIDRLKIGNRICLAQTKYS